MFYWQNRARGKCVAFFWFLKNENNNGWKGPGGDLSAAGGGKQGIWTDWVLCILYQLTQVVRRKALEKLLKRFQDEEEIFEQVDEDKFKTAGLRSLDDK